MNERNFHIFYQILSNRDFLRSFFIRRVFRFYSSNLDQFGLNSTDIFHYLNPLFQSNDAEALAKTQYAMEIIGLSKDVQNHLFGLLIGILHLGNIQFENRDNYAAFRIDQSEKKTIDLDEFVLFCFVFSDFAEICRYFGIDEDFLKKKLITKRLEFKEQQENRRIEQRFTYDKAIFTRDALAKGIYARIFDFLIQVEVEQRFRSFEIFFVCI